jgi:hypothetical protein
MKFDVTIRDLESESFFVATSVDAHNFEQAAVKAFENELYTYIVHFSRMRKLEVLEAYEVGSREHLKFNPTIRLVVKSVTFSLYKEK